MNTLQEKISVLKLSQLNSSMMFCRILDTSLEAINVLEDENPHLASTITMTIFDHLNKFMEALSLHKVIDMVIRRVDDEDVKEDLTEKFESIMEESKKTFSQLIKGKKKTKKKLLKESEFFMRNLRIESGLKPEIDEDELASFSSGDDSSMSDDEGSEEVNNQMIPQIEWKQVDSVVSDSSDITDQDSESSFSDKSSSFQNLDSGMITPILLEINPTRIKFQKTDFQVNGISNECSFAFENCGEGVIVSLSGEIVHYTIKGGEVQSSTIIEECDSREFTDVVYSPLTKTYIAYCSRMKQLVKINTDTLALEILGKRRIFGDTGRKMRIESEGRYLCCLVATSKLAVYEISQILESWGTLPEPYTTIDNPFDERICDFQFIESSNSDEICVLTLTFKGNLTLLRKDVSNLERGVAKSYYQFGIPGSNSNLTDQIYTTLAVDPASEMIAVASSMLESTCRHSLYWLRIDEDFSLELINSIPIPSKSYCSSIYALEFHKLPHQPHQYLFARSFWTQDSHLSFFLDEEGRSIKDISTSRATTGTNEYCRSVKSTGNTVMSLSRCGRISAYTPSYDK